MAAKSDSADLDQRRIQHAAYERRVLLRARFFTGLTALCCIVGSALAIQYFVEGLNNHAKWTFLGIDALAVAVLLLTALGLARTCRQTHRLLQKNRQTSDAKPPDFAPLSDGSQRARNLDKLK